MDLKNYDDKTLPVISVKLAENKSGYNKLAKLIKIIPEAPFLLYDEGDHEVTEWQMMLFGATYQSKFNRTCPDVEGILCAFNDKYEEYLAKIYGLT